jgi:hypothetical protein
MGAIGDGRSGLDVIGLSLCNQLEWGRRQAVRDEP